MSDPKSPLPPENRQAAGASLDSLSFLDLIYTVPVGDLAMRVSGAKLDQVSAADWSALAMILTVIVLSWIGVHKDRADLAEGPDKRDVIGEFPFFGLRFVQFAVEVFIIGLYFVMGLHLELPTSDHMAASPPSERSLAQVLLWIFIAYLVWDILDVWLARRAGNLGWQGAAAAGGAVTFPFLIAMAIIYLMISSAPLRTAEPVVWWNVVLMAVLYGYRVTQDVAKGKARLHPAWWRLQHR